MYAFGLHKAIINYKLNCKGWREQQTFAKPAVSKFNQSWRYYDAIMLLIFISSSTVVCFIFNKWEPSFFNYSNFKSGFLLLHKSFVQCLYLFTVFIVFTVVRGSILKFLVTQTHFSSAKKHKLTWPASFCTCKDTEDNKQCIKDVETTAGTVKHKITVHLAVHWKRKFSSRKILKRETTFLQISFDDFFMTFLGTLKKFPLR